MRPFSRRHDETQAKLDTYRKLEERWNLLDTTCGVGLWEAVLHQADAMHPQSQWTWSPEFRRLIGFSSEAEFPNVVQSWSDRLHPDDVEATFAAFGGHLGDKSGKARYDVNYRLKMRDGEYRWFRATGGCRHSGDGTIRACGSLTDIHEATFAAQARTAAAADDARIIACLEEAFQAIAKRDLSFRVTDSLPPRVEQLKVNLNAALEQIEGAMGQIRETASAIQGGSQELTQASDDLARRTEQQAASLEETSAALREITDTVQQAASGAAEAARTAAATTAEANASGEIVTQAVSAMAEIEKSSGKIGNIIGVIDEIAFQTNLLALNAGVEAARAGEAGRGFAVVAQEVRGLAQRSAEAAKEIKDLISISSTQVETGVSLVGRTGEALRHMVEQVRAIDKLIAEISVSGQNQSSTLREINAAVGQMDKVVQQNAAMVEQSTAACHALLRDSEGLTDMVTSFKVVADRSGSGGVSGSHSSARRQSGDGIVVPLRAGGRG